VAHTKTLKICFEDWESFKSRSRGILAAKAHLARDTQTLVFASVAVYQKFMTEQKLSVLAAVLRHKPASIYKLAQLVERDFANVQRDCVALEGMGFMALKKSKGPRSSKVPKLAFEYTRILIEMSQLSYSHHLKAA
jgi:predicted transcriptional regulator